MFVCLLHPEIYKEALANPYYKYAYVKPPKPKSAMKKNLKHTKSRCQKLIHRQDLERRFLERHNLE